MNREDASGLARVHEVLKPWVSRQPHALAIKDAHHALTYAQVDSHSALMCERLREQGVRPGDRVLLVGENCAVLGVAFLALSKLGAWASVVNARLSEREIHLFVSHSGARRVIYFNHISDDARAHAERAGATPFPTDFGDLAIGPLAPHVQPEPVFAAATEQVAALVYTSGTTGAPKGVMLTHAGLLFTAQSAKELRRLAPGDVIYGVLPMSHVVGLSLLLSTLHSGAALYLEPRFTPAAAAKAFAHDQITIFTGVPALYARLLEWARQAGTPIDAPHLRLISVAGAPLTASLKAEVEQAFGLPLQNAFGLTETSPTVAQAVVPRKDCSVGPPIPGVEVRFVGDAGQDVPPGSIGELWVRSPGVMQGYYQNPQLTADAVTPSGWFKTGDLAYALADGALVISGRSKELIIRSGFNVYPLEVEEVLNTYPGVVQSAVVGRDVPDNEEVVAFLEVRHGSTIDHAHLLGFLRERLSPYKLPSEVRAMGALPSAPNGKILKHLLKETAKQAPRTV